VLKDAGEPGHRSSQPHFKVHMVAAAMARLPGRVRRTTPHRLLRLEESGIEPILS